MLDSSQRHLDNSSPDSPLDPYWWEHKYQRKCIGLIVWPGSSSLTWCAVPSCSVRWSDEMLRVESHPCARWIVISAVDALGLPMKQSVAPWKGQQVLCFNPEYVIIFVIISRWRRHMCSPCTERPDDSQAKHRATQNRDTATYLVPAQLITAFPFNLKCGPECTKKCVSKSLIQGALKTPDGFWIAINFKAKWKYLLTLADAFHVHENSYES